MNSKEYTLPNGKKAVFEYDMFGIGMISLECMDELMAMIADRPQGEWIEHKGKTIVMDNNFVDFFPTEYECSNCGLRRATYFINSPLSNYCPNCGADMRKGAGDEVR